METIYTPRSCSPTADTLALHVIDGTVTLQAIHTSSLSSMGTTQLSRPSNNDSCQKISSRPAASPSLSSQASTLTGPVPLNEGVRWNIYFDFTRHFVVDLPSTSENDRSNKRTLYLLHIIFRIGSDINPLTPRGLSRVPFSSSSTAHSHTHDNPATPQLLNSGS